MEKKLKYQKHPLSFTPGGVTVKVEWKNGKVSSYDNIKYPNNYMNKIISENPGGRIIDIYVYDPAKHESKSRFLDDSDDLPF